MKKIFTFLMATMVAAVGFAVPAQKVNLAENAKVQMAQKNLYESIKSGKIGNDVVTCSSVDKNGETWDVYFQNVMEAPGLFVGDYTMETFPAHVVVCGVVNNDQSQYYNIAILWPAYAAEFLSASADGMSYDIDAAKAKYGDNWNKIVSFSDIYDVCSNNEALTQECIDGDKVVFNQWANGFGYLFPAFIQTSYWLDMPSTYNGDETYYTLAGTSLSISNYDADTQSCDVHFKGSIGKIIVLNDNDPQTDEEYVSASSKKAFDIDTTGEITQLGFESVTYNLSEKIGEVHVFNSGISNYDSQWGQCYYDEYEDVTRYWLVFTTNEFSYVIEDNGNILPANNCYDATTLPTEGPGVYTTDTMPSNFVFFQGALFAPADAEKPYGLWTAEDWVIEYNDNYKTELPSNVPAPYTMFAGRYTGNQASVQDGIQLLYSNFFRIPNTKIKDGTKFGIGDKEKGFNIIMNDINGDVWGFTYKGDIYFHNDPTDYTKVEMIPAVADGNYDAGDLAGVESVVVDNNKLAVKVVGNSIVAPEGAKVFNLNGVQVNAENLANGVYIVVAGEKAAKVLVK